MKNNKTVMMNENIRAKKVNCISHTGENLGVMDTNEALAMVADLGLDLVCLNDTQDPPIVKMMDYAKEEYRKQKQNKENQKKNKTVVKELKFSLNIATNDISYKVKHALEFLEKGFLVKLIIRLSGREVGAEQSYTDLMTKIFLLLEDSAVKDGEAKLEGRNFVLNVRPKK